MCCSLLAVVVNRRLMVVALLVLGCVLLSVVAVARCALSAVRCVWYVAHCPCLSLVGGYCAVCSMLCLNVCGCCCLLCVVYCVLFVNCSSVSLLVVG